MLGVFYVTSTVLAPSQDLASIERAESLAFPGMNGLPYPIPYRGGFEIVTILLPFPRLGICILCIPAPSASVSVGQRHDGGKCNVREVLSAEKYTKKDIMIHQRGFRQE